MNLKKLSFLLPVLTALVVAVASFGNLRLNVFADGTGSEAACDNADQTSVNPNDDGSTTPFVFNFDAGSGNIVTGVCIKSGNSMFVDSHSGLLGNGSYENGCYTISGVGTQFLTVTRNNSGRTCQEISHLDIETDSAASPSPTPSPSPSPSPSVEPSPSPEVSPSPTPSPSPEVSPSPSPTPSPSPSPDDECEGVSCNTGGSSPTPSPTPSPSPSATPSPSPEASPSPSASGGSNSSSSGGGQVLGASTGPTTLAATGDPLPVLFAGFAMISLGAWLVNRNLQAENA